MQENDKIPFCTKLKTQPIFREKVLYTVWICWTFIMLGWTESLFGPTFPDLRQIIGENLDTASWLFTSTSAGFLVGSAITGVLLDRYNKLLLMIGSILGTSVTLAAVPWCPYFWLMLVVKFLSGMLTASLDTGGNTEIVSTWGTEAGPYMQTLHFCFSVGGMVAPFVAKPFLAEKLSVGQDHLIKDNLTESFDTTTLSAVNNSQHDLTDTRRTNAMYIPLNWSHFGNISIEGIERGNNTDVNAEVLFGETSVQYAYLLTAVLILLTVIPFSVMYYTQPAEKPNERIEKRDPTNFKSVSLPRKIIVLGTLSVLMIVYVGTDDIYAGFLMTFVISHLKWSKSDGSFASSLHWICFGVARLGCIFLVRYVRTCKLIILFSIALVISLTGLFIAVTFHITPLIWIFLGCPGLSLSIIFPAIFTWTNENVVIVSGKISAMYLMATSTGVMLFPLQFGYTMERFSLIWFLYLLLGQSVVLVIFFLFTIVITKCLLKKTIRETSVTVAEIEPLNTEMKK